MNSKRTTLTGYMYDKAVFDDGDDDDDDKNKYIYHLQSIYHVPGSRSVPL